MTNETLRAEYDTLTSLLAQQKMGGNMIRNAGWASKATIAEYDALTTATAAKLDVVARALWSATFDAPVADEGADCPICGTGGGSVCGFCEQSVYAEA